MVKIIVFILYIFVVPILIIYNILVWIGQLVTSPFRRVANRLQDWSDNKLYENYGNRKFFFYSNTNRRIVESDILPLIRGKFEVFFIDKDKIDTWDEEIVLKRLIKNQFKKSQFPYLFKIEKQGYCYLSLSKGIKQLKERRITQLQFERNIFDFFKDDDNINWQ